MMEIIEMKHLIKKLKTGLSPKWFHLVQRRPEQAIDLMRRMSADVQLGGEKLEEAWQLVNRLMSEDRTFGDTEIALRWLDANKDL